MDVGKGTLQHGENQGRHTGKQVGVKTGSHGTGGVKAGRQPYRDGDCGDTYEG